MVQKPMIFLLIVLVVLSYYFTKSKKSSEQKVVEKHYEQQGVQGQNHQEATNHGIPLNTDTNGSISSTEFPKPIGVKAMNLPSIDPRAKLYSKMRGSVLHSVIKNTNQCFDARGECFFPIHLLFSLFF
jgi:hypothetical protein